MTFENPEGVQNKYFMKKFEADRKCMISKMSETFFWIFLNFIICCKQRLSITIGRIMFFVFLRNIIENANNVPCILGFI